MKSLCLLLVLLFVCGVAVAGELKHIIKDSEIITRFDDSRWDCIEKEHLWIDLSQEGWNKICGRDINFKRQTPFSAQICIKCRKIAVSCCGNDWYEYEIGKERKDEKDWPGIIADTLYPAK